MRAIGESPGTPDLGPGGDSWNFFGMELEGVLGRMAEPGDQLTLELPGAGDASGAGPRVRFATRPHRDGLALRGEIRGDANLAPRFAMGAEAERGLRAAGWRAVRELDGGASAWNVRRRCGDAAVSLAADVVAVLRDHCAVVRPEFLAATVDGPVADESFGLLWVVGTDEVPQEPPLTAPVGEPAPVSPATSDELIALVREAVAAWLGEEPGVDDDGDVLIIRGDQWLWVHVMPEQPGVELSSRVVSGVTDRRAAAVEIALLNRDRRWIKWVLRDDDIWQIVHLPAAPFIPFHLTEMLDMFLAARADTMADLALRTQGVAQ
ncbi:MAG: T3SS (YopN, CesT) and YbjN peptide-binding chaperone 1 [Dietzia sp.]